ncbi:MAG: hypothetical protein ABIQ02_06720, partial [Saprospiraceae bacterium]
HSWHISLTQSFAANVPRVAALSDDRICGNQCRLRCSGPAFVAHYLNSMLCGKCATSPGAF